VNENKKLAIHRTSSGADLLAKHYKYNYSGTWQNAQLLYGQSNSIQHSSWNVSYDL